MKTLKRYKGYTATVDIDIDSGVLHGRVIGLRDVVTFESANVKGLQKEFQSSIDDYLEFCKEESVEPEKPYSGNIVLRMPKSLHKKLDIISSTEGKSINKLIISLLEEDVKSLA
jgi:predicted HicB family RNase H-like nuclease